MHFNLGISALSNTSCKRKRCCYIISRKKGFFFDDESQKDRFGVFGELGKIVHFIIQHLSKYFTDYLEYYYYRKRLPLAEAVGESADIIFDYFAFLLKTRVILGDITNSNYVDIYNYYNDQRDCFKKKFEILIQMDDLKQKIHSKIIDDEFEVSIEICPNIICVGKIDLVGFDDRKRCLEIYEIKTGSPKNKIADHRRQLKLYKEFFEKTRNVSLKIWLWNTKPGPEDDYFGTITQVKTTKTSELKKIKEFVKYALNIKNREQLPPEKNRNFTSMCDYCFYCDNLDVILPKKIQSTLFSLQKIKSSELKTSDINYEMFVKSLKFNNSDKINNIKLLTDYL